MRGRIFCKENLGCTHRRGGRKNDYFVTRREKNDILIIEKIKAGFYMDIVNIVFLPVLGTALGSAAVFFMRGTMNKKLERILMGFAAGVMVAASVWSLLIPAIERSEHLGRLSFFPAAAGFVIGIFMMLMIDKIIPHLNFGTEKREGIKSKLKKNSMLVLAIVIHNFPEGMAVGAVLAAVLSGAGVTVSAALALSMGIAIQNFPEGAIISLPLAASGVGKTRSCIMGVLSGLVEPLGAVLTVAASRQMVPSLPYLLAFAAGAMLYVVVEELVPEMNGIDQTDDWGTVMFSLGFVLMMILDVMLG